MRTLRTGLLLASAVSALALTACNKAADKPVAAAPAGATEFTVNGSAISTAQVDAVLNQRLKGQPAPPEARKAIIDTLTLQTVVAQEAVKAGLDKTPEFQAEIETVRTAALANAYVEDWIKKNPVSDEALKVEYDKLKGQSAGIEFKARHILVEKEADAKAIVATLKKTPAAFEKIAKDKSKDPGSKGNGGDLGWFDPAGMVPEFSAALAKLEKGQFTEEPVKTQFGYHVILLEDTRKPQPPALDAVKPQLSQQLMQQNVRKQIEALKAGAKIEMAAAASAPPAEPASAASK